MVSADPDKLRHIYDIVSAVPNLAADAVLVSVLPQLDHSLRALAMEKLLERGQLGGLTALVGRFAGFDTHLRELVLGSVDRLFEATRVAMESDSVEARLSAVEMIRSSRNCALSYLLSEVFRLRCTRTTPAAAAALRDLAADVVRRRGERTGPAEQRSLRCAAGHLAGALRRALDGWQLHLRTEVLVAAAFLSDVLEPALFEKASKTRLHLSRALSAVAESEPDPAVAGFVLRALRHPDLRSAAAERIATTVDRRFVEQLLDEMWITADRDCAKACARIRELPWLDDERWSLSSLDPGRARSAVKLVALSGLASSAKLKLFSRLSGGRSEALREAAVWGVVGMDGPAACESLTEAVSSSDDVVSQIALQELFRRDPWTKRYRSRANFRPPPPAEVARSIETDCDAYWDRFDQLDEAQRQSAGQRLRARSPERFSRELRMALASGDPDHRGRALAIIRTLGNAVEYEERIYALNHDPNRKVRSLAVALLSEIEGVTALRILRRSLNDPDARVQANAVEVLSERDLEQFEHALTEKLGADNNRVRANAVKALLPLRVREAALVLVAMLADTSPAQRLSALWVVEQLGLATLAPRVRKIASEDSEEHLRERAERVLASGRFAAAINEADGTVEVG